jgi:hypothetical protein
LPAASSRWGRATIGHEELIVLTDQIYEAALDGGRWPGVLITLVDAIGAAHVSIAPGTGAPTASRRSRRARIQISLPPIGNIGRSIIRFPGTAVRPVGEI